MSDQIFFDGLRYISANDAAAFSDFTRDYVARLCRDGKVRGRRVGKNWYVDESSFKAFLVTQEYTKSRRNQSLARERVQEYKAGEIAPAGKQASVQSAPASSAAAAGILSGKGSSYKPAPASHAIQGRVDGIREKMLQALSAQTSKTTEGVSKLAYAPGGFTSAALQAAHIPTYTLTPLMEFAHKLIALTLTLALVFGTYAVVDPQYAHFAADSVHDEIASATASYNTATGGGLGALAARTQSQVASVAENPQLAAAGVAGIFGNAIPNAAASIARAFNSRVNDLVYAIAFPTNLLGSHGVAANSSGSSVSVSVQPYARPTLAVATSTSPAPSNSTSPAVIERIVVQPAVSQTLAQSGGITQAELSQQLNQLDNKLSSRMFSLTAAQSTVTAQNYNVTAQTNAIDNLSGVAISGGTITGAAISGGSISGVALSAGDLMGVVGFAQGGTGTSSTPAYGQLLVGNTSGGYDLLATSSLGIVSGGTPGGSDTQVQFNDSGTFGGNAGFTFASSTQTLFAVNASTTNATSTTFFATLGTITTGVITNLTSTLAAVTDLTATNLVATNATTTNATTTNLAVTGSANLATTTITNLSVTNTSTSTFAGNLDVNGNFNFNGVILQNNAPFISSQWLTNGSNIYYTAGNVGIGTTSPTRKLEVAGNTFLGGNLTATGTLAVSGATTLSSTLNVTGDTTLENATAANLFSVNASTTNATSTNLAVTGSANLATTTTTALTAGTTTLTNLSVTNTSTSTFAGSLSVNGNFNFNGAIFQNNLPFISSQWITSGSNISYTAGNVGIGNASPAYPLDVSGAGHFTGLVDADHFVATSSSATSLFNGNFLVMGSTTLQNFTFVNAVGTNATTTTLFSTTASSTNLFSQTAQLGSLTVLGATTHTGLASFNLASTTQLSVFSKAYFGGSATSTFDSTGALTLVNALTYGGVTLSNAVSGTGSMVLSANPIFTGTTNFAGFLSTGSSTITSGLFTANGGASTTNFTASGNVSLGNSTTTTLFSTTASSTNLFAQTASFGSLTLVSALGIASGGTNATSFSTGQPIYYDGTRFVSTSTLALVYGGTGANLSATGGTSQVLKQTSAGGAITVGQLAASDLSNGTTGSGSVVLATGPTLAGFLSTGSSTITAGLFTANGGASTTNFTASGSVSLGNATSTTLFSTTASSTNLFAQTASFGSLTLVSALPITSGGTNQTSFSTGQPLAYDGTRFVSTSTLSSVYGGTGQNSSAWNGLAAVNAGVWTSLSTTSLNASITGNAGTATALQTPRNINNVSFNGTGDITIFAASSTLLSNNNTFSGNNTFGGLTSFNLASTTQLSVFQKAYFGGSATTTIDSSGNVAVAGTLSVTGATTLGTASTTLFSSYGPAYFGASATSTFDSTGALTLVNALTYGGVTLSNAVTGTGNMVLSASPTFTGTANFNLASTTQLSVFTKAYFGGSATTTIDSAGNVVIPSTATLTVGNLSGAVSASGGVLSAGTLSIANGGTNATTFTTGQPIYFDGTRFVSTSTLSAVYGGTGVNNGSNTITLGGNISTANAFTTSGNFALTLTQTGATNSTLPSGTHTLVGQDTTDTFTNKTFDTGGAGNVFRIAGTQYTAVTGTGATLVAAASPVFTGTANFNLASTSQLSVFQKAYFGGSATSTFDSAGNLALVSNGLTVGTNQLIVSGGNVGVGTTVPSANLSIQNNYGSTNTTLFSIASSTASDGSTADMLFSVAKTGATAIGNALGTGDSNFQFADDSNAWSVGYYSTDKTFRIASSTSLNSNVVFALTKSGNVGIGATAPSAKLSILGGTGIGSEQLFDIASSTGNSLFHVNSGGNVGLGTTTPWAQLSVAGVSLGTTPLFTISTSTASATTTVFYIGPNGNTTIGNNGSVLTVNGATSTFANGIALTTGCFSVGGNCITGGGGASLSAQNTWTALQIFSAGASTTQLSVFQKAYFGGSATSSFDSTGALTLVQPLNFNLGSASTTLINLNGQQLLTASSTTQSISFGLDALGSSSPLTSNEIALGYQALYNDVSGNDNFAAGYQALFSNTTGTDNNAFGNSALQNNTTGFDNNALGSAALISNTTGTDNNAFGVSALINSTGSFNVALGSSAGANLTAGDNNIIIGSGFNGNGINFASTTGSNQLNIGNLIFGTGLDGTGSTLSTGNVGIGATAPSAKLSIQGGAGVTSEQLFDIASSTGSSLFHVNSGGNIGIGTTTPWAKLSVNSFNGGTIPLFVVASSSNALATTTAFIIDKSGNVGIGTTSPAGLLDVSGSSNSTALTTFAGSRALSIINTDTTANNASGFDFRTNDLNGLLTTGAKIMGVYTSHTANAVSADLAFLTRNAGTVAENMRLTATGNLGIGTTTPSAKLSILGGAGVTSEQLFDIASSTGNSLFHVNSGGNIGIGTTTPAVSLDVVGTQYNQLSLGTAAGTAKMYLGTDGSANAYWQANRKTADGVFGDVNKTANSIALINANGAGYIQFNTSNTNSSAPAEAMRITGAGNVGIATTTPFSFLTVGTGDGTQRDLGVFNGAICADDGGATKCFGALTAGVVYGDSSNFAASDVAENYPTKDATLSAGEIISLDTSATTTVKRASAGHAPFGVVSTAPGVLLGGDATSSVPVALTGRVPVKVNLDGGPIAVGDRITLSSVAGVGAKATTTSYTIGIALDNYTAPTASSTILVFIQPQFSFTGVQEALAALGAFGATTTPAVVTGSFMDTFLHNLFAQLTNWLADAKNGIGDFFANAVHTKKLCVGDSGGETCITKAQLDTLLAGQTASAASTGGGSAGGNSSSGGVSSGANSTSSTAPVISVSGNNPATINVGASYADLGATITGPAGDTNLGINASVDGGATTTASAITLDTSAAGTHTIVYSATDQQRQTGTASRTVNVIDPNAGGVSSSGGDSSGAASSTPDTATSTTDMGSATTTGTTATSTP